MNFVPVVLQLLEEITIKYLCKTKILMLITNCCSLHLKTETEKLNFFFFFFPRQGILGHPVTFLFHYRPPSSESIFTLIIIILSIYRAHYKQRHTILLWSQEGNAGQLWKQGTRLSVRVHPRVWISWFLCLTLIPELSIFQGMLKLAWKMWLVHF